MRRFLLLALAVLVAGCGGGMIRPRVEDRIEKALPDYIGPAKDYRVRADGPSVDMLNGYIEKLTIEGDEVQVDPALTVESLTVVMHDVRYNPKKRSVTSVRETRFTGTINEQAVNKYVETRGGAEYQAKVKLSPGRIQLSLVTVVLGMSVPVTVEGKPEVAGSGVNFVAESGSVAHLPVPAYVINKVLDRINPVIDLSVLRFPVKIETIDLKSGAVELGGTAEFNPAK
ncbi:MAG: LmeA family phospholipid-binding protein [Armatimonadota bacterium]